MTKEEILGSNDIGSGSLYFNRAMQSMDEYAEQQAIAFLNWVQEDDDIIIGAKFFHYKGEPYTTEQLYKLWNEKNKQST